MSQLDAAIRFCGLFEAELLVELMLRYWGHPCCEDKDVVNHLVEAGADILKRSRGGETLIQEIEPGAMNFVAAIWYAEWSHVQDSHDPDVQARNEWLHKIRRSLPSCFCDPDDLA